MANRNSFKKLTNCLRGISRNFFESQLRCANKKPQAWRFNVEDKITALALYKQTGSGYKFLQQLFNLPLRVTIMKFVNNIHIEPSFNKAIFEGLKDMGKRLPKLEKYCSLLFYELTLAPNLSYCRFKDKVEGFEDFGDSRSNKIVDHIQVCNL